jgi:hypothetical protein
MREIAPGIFFPTEEEIDQMHRDFCASRDATVLERYGPTYPEHVDLMQSVCDLDEVIERKKAELDETIRCLSKPRAWWDFRKDRC